MKKTLFLNIVAILFTFAITMAPHLAHAGSSYKPFGLSAGLRGQ